MVKRTVARLTLMLPAVLLLAAPAFAQFVPRALNDPATGEQYHIEASGGIWMPKTQMTISSEALGIQGSDINFKGDLGLTDQSCKELHLVLLSTCKHKLRFS